MKKIIIPVVLSFAIVASLGARTINYTSGFPTGGGTFSDGTDWTADMIFEVGAFSDGVAGNMENWVTMPASAAVNAAPWNPAFEFYQGSFSYNSNDAPFTAGSQAYVWGFNSKTLDVASEWIVMTDPSWVIQTADVSNPTALQFDVGAGTTAIIGTLTGGNTFQSAQAIPEPSTYALIFGLGILGFLGFRRFRK